MKQARAWFTAVGVPNGGNKYKVPSMQGIEEFTIDLIPNILTIQSERLSYTRGQGGTIDSKKVEFGTTADKKPFASNGQD